MKYYYQTGELDIITNKPHRGLAYTGRVEAKDPKTALSLARKEINKENVWRKKNNEPPEEAPDLPPVQFVVTVLKDEFEDKIFWKI